MESLILKDHTGAIVTSPMMSDEGLKLDGTFGPCFTASSTTPERVKPLTWGHYTLTVQGRMGGTVASCQTFDMFVPPGSSPQTYSLVVNAYDANADGGATCP